MVSRVARRRLINRPTSAWVIQKCAGVQHLIPMGRKQGILPFKRFQLPWTPAGITRNSVCRRPVLRFYIHSPTSVVPPDHFLGGQICELPLNQLIDKDICLHQVTLALSSRHATLHSHSYQRKTSSRAFSPTLWMGNHGCKGKCGFCPCGIPPRGRIWVTLIGKPRKNRGFALLLHVAKGPWPSGFRYPRNPASFRPDKADAGDRSCFEDRRSSLSTG